MILILGLTAAFFTTFAFVPQAIRTIKTKNTAGLSLGMYIMSTFGVLLWLIYGIRIGDIAVTAANAVSFIFAATILSYKIRNVINHKEN